MKIAESSQAIIKKSDGSFFGALELAWGSAIILGPSLSQLTVFPPANDMRSGSHYTLWNSTLIADFFENFTKIPKTRRLIKFEPDWQKAKTAHHSMLGLTVDDNTVEHESQGQPGLNPASAEVTPVARFHMTDF